MPKTAKVNSVAKDVQVVELEYGLLVLVGGLLILFYLLIAWILRSSEADRKARLSKLH